MKQKRQACAAFLGVLTFRRNVLSVCCILTTNLAATCPGNGIRDRAGSCDPGRGHAFARINLPVKIRLWSRSRHEKGRSAGRCGLHETCPGRRPFSCGRRRWTNPNPMRERPVPAWPSSAPVRARARALAPAPPSPAPPGSGGLGSCLLFPGRALLGGLLRCGLYFVRPLSFLGGLLRSLLGGFLCALFRSLLRRFLRGLLDAFFDAFLADFFFATTAFLAFLAFLPFLLFFAIWSSCCGCPCLSSASNSPWARPGRHFFEVPSRSIPCPGMISGQTFRRLSRANRMPVPPSTCGATLRIAPLGRSINSIL